jgi:hypothetical protein
MKFIALQGTDIELPPQSLIMIIIIIIIIVVVEFLTSHTQLRNIHPTWDV